jgi:hypothetical protein
MQYDQSVYFVNSGEFELSHGELRMSANCFPIKEDDAASHICEPTDSDEDNAGSDVDLLRTKLVRARNRYVSAEKSRRLKHINCLLLKSRLRRLVLAQAFETLVTAARADSPRRATGVGDLRVALGVLRLQVRTLQSSTRRSRAAALLARWSVTRRLAKARRVALQRLATRLRRARRRRAVHAWAATAQERAARRALRCRAESCRSRSLTARLHVLFLHWRLAVTARASEAAGTAGTAGRAAGEAAAVETGDAMQVRADGWRSVTAGCG